METFFRNSEKDSYQIMPRRRYFSHMVLTRAAATFVRAGLDEPSASPRKPSAIPAGWLLANDKSSLPQGHGRHLHYQLTASIRRHGPEGLHGYPRRVTQTTTVEEIDQADDHRHEPAQPAADTDPHRLNLNTGEMTMLCEIPATCAGAGRLTATTVKAARSLRHRRHMSTPQIASRETEGRGIPPRADD